MDSMYAAFGVLHGWGADVIHHTGYPIWHEDEERMRASYLHTRRHLSRFLVPHRFEGDSVPATLPRASYGFGLGLNRSWIQELAGHVRTAPTTYWWGALAGMAAEDTVVGEPKEGTLAHQLWSDATLTGRPWTEFHESDVLEWVLSSVGGFVVWDLPPRGALPDGRVRTQRDDQEQGRRAYARFVPMSQVVDFGYSREGWEWIRLLEVDDPRGPDDFQLKLETAAKIHVITIWRDASGTHMKRTLPGGEVVGEVVNYGRLVDRRRRPCLTAIPCFFGQHPDLPMLGSGLIFGLHDLVIDAFNVWSETREDFRDACFGFLKHIGRDPEKVRQAFADGSRFITLGEPYKDEQTGLERIAGDGSGVDRGLQLMEFIINAWAEGAKRKASEATQREGARSGISLQAEFQLDSRPLLVWIAETLDTIESEGMHLAAQLHQVKTNLPRGMKRDTNFRQEDEALRIARIAGEVKRAVSLPGIVEKETLMAILASLDWLDLDKKVEGEGGARTLRDEIEAQAAAVAERRQDELTQPPQPTFASGGGF